MKHLSILIKPASAACNLRCKYCFYADVSRIRSVPSHGIMRQDVVDGMLASIRRELNPGDSVSFAFQGGEPTLAGLGWFESFVSAVSGWDPGIRVQYAFQTNGVLLDDSWCRFLKRHGFLVGLSMDLLSREHNESRVDPAGAGSWKQVVNALNLLKQHGVEFNVLCTLTKRIARHPREVWNQINKLDLQYVQFTPCLDDLEAEIPGEYGLEPKRFAAFYKELFNLWLRDFQAGKYRSIKLFDDLVNLLAFGRTTACGILGVCQSQIVVESDGSVYPCDFYCVDRYCLGNIARLPLRDLVASPTVGEFVRREHTRPKLCDTCCYEKLCGGNCKRMQSNICCRVDDTFCGYRDFLDHAHRDLTGIALQQRASRWR